MTSGKPKRYPWKSTLKNGDTYDGEAIEGNIKDGEGTYTWASSGATYTGSWSQDQFHGQGKWNFPSEKDGFVYEGAFLRGKRHGNGVCHFSNGQIYKGEWKNDQMHGTGTLEGSALDNFIEYKGSFSFGQRHGSDGRCTYRNGDAYMGDWQNGIRHGQGELKRSFSSTGSSLSQPVQYKGEFAQDEPFGKGTIAYGDGSTFEGQVSNWLRKGFGELRDANGTIFRGYFQDDEKHGQGEVITTTGSRFEGTWVLGRMEGPVKYTASAAETNANNSDLPSLTSYTGPSLAGELTGSGANATFSDGSNYRGDMQNGVPEGKGVLTQRRIFLNDLVGFLLVVQYEGGFSAGKFEGFGIARFLDDGGASCNQCNYKITSTHKGFTIDYKQLSEYRGNWSGGVPQGSGELFWSNKGHYSGVMVSGIPHGVGMYQNLDLGILYKGIFSNGQPGPGDGVLRDTSLCVTYEGGWTNGLFDGEGKYTAQKNGTPYIYGGTWRSGNQHGRGLETSPSDSQYDGAFADGFRHGDGCLRKGDGTVYEGQFERGEITGSGKMTFPDGLQLIGQFKNGKPDGKVEAKFTNDVIFIGQYSDGNVEGVGEIRYSNGDVYHGEVEPVPNEVFKPQRHGKGKFKFAEGNILECTWIHNVLSGEGTYITATGERSKRVYAEGVLSSGASKSDNVFTPENEFPNTQFEEANKEKNPASAKPFKFMRKGGGGTAVDGSSAVAAKNTKAAPKAEISPPVSLSTKSVPLTLARRSSEGASSQNPANTPRKTVANGARRTSNTGGGASLPGKIPSITRLASAEKGSGKSSVPIGNEKAVLRVPSLGINSSALGNARGSFGAKNEKNNTLGVQVHLEKFQQGISQLETYSDSSIVHSTKTSTSDKQKLFHYSPPNDLNESNEVDSFLGSNGGKISPDKLMQKATAIRNSREDEISLLTEDLMQLNQKIWQLRFILDGTPKIEADPEKHKKLSTFEEERKGLVEKLQCVLSMR